MKVQICSYLLTAVMVFSGLAVGVSAGEKVNSQENAVAFNIVSAGYSSLPPNNGEWCTVSTDGGNLNIRNRNGKIVDKLVNGQEVWVSGYWTPKEGVEWAKISVEEDGKLRFLGYAVSEYISC